MISYLSRRPIKVKLLLYFLPILVSSVILTGYFSYYTAVKQLERNAYFLLNDTLEQTGVFLNDKFHAVFAQLVIIENNSAFQNILSNTDQDVDGHRYDDLIELHRQFDISYHNYDEMIDSIFVTFNNGRTFHMKEEFFIPRSIGINLQEWIKRFQNKESVNGYYWLNTHDDEVFNTVQPRKVMSVFKIYGNAESNVSAISLINMKESYLLNILRNVKVSPNGTLALISTDGVMYSKELASEYAISDSVIDQIKNNGEQNGEFKVSSNSGEPMMIQYTSLSLNKWKLAAIVPQSDILSKASQIKTITFIVVAIILLVFIVVATMFAGSLTNPIRYLSQQVKRVRQGNLDVSFQLSEQNELGVLAHGLESLVVSVKELLEKVKDEQEQKREIELIALQSQIQPHFLYNTLGSIKYLIDLDEKEKASTMVSALTHFFRIGISKGREVISLWEEIEHIRSYLSIQNIRYTGNFDFEIDIEESMLHLPIMKLTLQPIVENAIYHGIKSKYGRGSIRITGTQQGDIAILEIFDDGAGMHPEKQAELLASIQSHEVYEAPVTFGLRNVHRRLVLQFGRNYGLELESEAGVYTIVRVKIPNTGRGD
ncbi:sensor histidine kinase [Paenibacillus hexagrammi]|uniref:Sensor histidine kinase n=1 Tax=Paenibacillus hexagrammi TaxID=2908839 RepID=A0ABY3SF03_9BACL|nr:sensor histidine kinase [Paenibacillus sp. YPD9-1]UJF31731.1 sensor histidine kinase [Paenibacillus sp. YPD9-1]